MESLIIVEQAATAAMTERTIIIVAVLLAGVILAMTWMVTTNDDEGDRSYTDQDCYDRGLVPVSLWDPEGDVACDDPEPLGE